MPLATYVQVITRGDADARALCRECSDERVPADAYFATAAFAPAAVPGRWEPDAADVWCGARPAPGVSSTCSTLTA